MLNLIIILRILYSKLGQDIYNNIRININDKIRQLPKTMTFEELLCIKDKHKKEIKRLRHVISELEQRVVVEGDTHITSRIDKDFELAVKDLNRSETLSKVSSMETYASVPIGIAETISGIFPVAGTTVGVLGADTTAISSHFTKQNK